MLNLAQQAMRTLGEIRDLLTQIRDELQAARNAR